MDSIRDLQRLAGIVSEMERTNDGLASGGMSPIGSNISITGMEKRRLEREHNIKPGTPEWFQLWFSRPYLTNEPPVGSRTKKH